MSTVILKCGLLTTSLGTDSKGNAFRHCIHLCLNLFYQKSWHPYRIFKEGVCARTSALATQSYLNLCDPMNCNLPGSSVHRISQARVLEWVDIPFLTQGLNLGLLHCRKIVYHLSHQGSPGEVIVLLKFLRDTQV